MRQILYIVTILFFLASQVYADNGIITVKSSLEVKATADRLENVLKQKGMTVFLRINHAEGANKVGKKLRPTELVVFGNPKVSYIYSIDQYNC